MTNMPENPDIIELRKGLLSNPKKIPSKYFYDSRGSELFSQICTLEEYYLKRTEVKIMLENIGDIASYFNENTVFIELGAGSSEKTRILLNSIKTIQAYMPVDISGDYLIAAVEQLRKEFPDIRIIPVIADYTRQLNLPVEQFAKKEIIFYYPGSTIGNFTFDEAKVFLKKIYDYCDKNSRLLIGIDLLKPEEVLLRAYNDSQGVTAEFNLNILNNVNKILGSNFNAEYFYHRAIFNEKESRMEMYLISRIDQIVNIGGDEIVIKEGEKILTEYSHKYSLEKFRNLVLPFFKIEKIWTDENNYFSVQLLHSNK